MNDCPRLGGPVSMLDPVAEESHVAEGKHRMLIRGFQDQTCEYITGCQWVLIINWRETQTVGINPR